MANHPPHGAGAPGDRASEPKKSRWLLAEKFALPVALVLLPIIYQSGAAYLAWKNEEAATRETKRLTDAQKLRDQQDQRFQLYTNLLSKREEADASVRRGLFEKLMGTYLEANPRDPRTKLVELELLALNFHDALNLSPLFWELHRLIEQMPPGPAREDLRNQLERVARDVKDRQAAVLEVDGYRSPAIEVPLELLTDGGTTWTQNEPFKPRQVTPSTAQDPMVLRELAVTVIKNDAKNRRLFVQLASPGLEPISFWVDPFDFPLVNFSRISRTERVAVILDSYDDPKGIAKLILLYFPSSRSAIKDKPYIDDLMNTLLPKSGASAMSALPQAGGASDAAQK